MFPSTCKEACQWLVELGIEYKKTNSCKNDCVLYKYEYQDKVESPVCIEKRYRTYVGSKEGFTSHANYT